MDRTQAALAERVKELTCLHGVARAVGRFDVDLPMILQDVVGLLPPAWQHPDVAHARIVLDERTYATPGFAQTAAIQSADIVVCGHTRGRVEVAYSEPRPPADEGPFLEEERALIDSVAREMASLVGRRTIEEEQARLREQVRHADRLATIGQLSAGVAHELNEPLATMLGFAQLCRKVVAHDILDPKTRETLIQCNDLLNEDKLNTLVEQGVKEVDLLYIDGVTVSPCLRNTLAVDKTATMKEAILEIYRRLRPSNRPNEEVATNFFNNLFFNPEFYDLSPVGRLKLDLKLRKAEDRLPLTQTTLAAEDILMSVRELITQKDKEGPVDDIDHLGNRRVRAVGELLENQFRVELVDPPAISDLEPLWNFLSERRRVKVLHAARQDLEVLWLATGAAQMPGPIFDTQIAAALLGYPAQIGYGSLVAERLGHTLAKGHARTDWTRRPLSEEQLHYAQDDVRYLVPLHADLDAALREAGRLEWEAAFDAVQEAVFATDRDGRLLRVNRAFARLLGVRAHELGGRGLSEVMAGHPERWWASPADGIVEIQDPVFDTLFEVGERGDAAGRRRPPQEVPAGEVVCSHGGSLKTGPCRRRAPSSIAASARQS